MLSFKEKSAILDTFPELTKKEISLKRVNYHYLDSVVEKKIVIKHLHPNGNGYVYVGHIRDEEAYEGADDKGYLSIRELDEEQIKAVVREAIASLQIPDNEEMVYSYTSSTGERLVLKFEHELWNIYVEGTLEMAFETKEEALEYLSEQ